MHPTLVLSYHRLPCGGPESKGLQGVGGLWEGSETNVEWTALLSPVGELLTAGNGFCVDRFVQPWEGNMISP